MKYRDCKACQYYWKGAFSKEKYCGFPSPSNLSTLIDKVFVCPKEKKNDEDRKKKCSCGNCNCDSGISDRSYGGETKLSD